MRKSRLLSLAAMVLLAGAALFSAPAARASDCLCEILCWQSGSQLCYQDECCRLYCCDIADPGCSVPC